MLDADHLKTVRFTASMSSSNYRKEAPMPGASLSSSTRTTPATPLAVVAPVVGPRVEWRFVRPEAGPARLVKERAH
jgi:hypothetical protein